MGDRSEPNMARFAGEYEETFTVDAEVEVAKQHFGSPEQIAKNHGDLERWEDQGEGKIHYVLKPKSEKGVTFNGVYTCQYGFASADVFEWKTVGSGNVWSSGSIHFAKAGEGRSRLIYKTRMECEMQVNRFLAKMIKGIVSREISKGSKSFLDRMRSSLRA